jgi:hypothetical protein
VDEDARAERRRPKGQGRLDQRLPDHAAARRLEQTRVPGQGDGLEHGLRRPGVPRQRRAKLLGRAEAHEGARFRCARMHVRLPGERRDQGPARRHVSDRAERVRHVRAKAHVLESAEQRRHRATGSDGRQRGEDLPRARFRHPLGLARDEPRHELRLAASVAALCESEGGAPSPREVGRGEERGSNLDGLPHIARLGGRARAKERERAKAPHVLTCIVPREGPPKRGGRQRRAQLVAHLRRHAPYRRARVVEQRRYLLGRLDVPLEPSAQGLRQLRPRRRLDFRGRARPRAQGTQLGERRRSSRARSIRCSGSPPGR